MVADVAPRLTCSIPHVGVVPNVCEHDEHRRTMAHLMANREVKSHDEVALAATETMFDGPGVASVARRQ